MIYLQQGDYRGEGNIDLDFQRKAISVIGTNGVRLVLQPLSFPETRAFTLDTPAPGSSIEQLTIMMEETEIVTGGLVTQGGGIYISNGFLLLRSVVFQNVHVDTRDSSNFRHAGGAVFVDAGATTVFEDCVFEACTAVGGGAVRTNGHSHNTFRRSMFIFNHAVIVGGAVLAEENSRSYFEDCLFIENFAPYGGAIDDDAREVQVRSSLFFRNSASYGGAYYTFGHARVFLWDTVFESNTASVSGGAFYQQSDQQTEIHNCTFRANLGASGGVIRSNDGHLILDNCDIVGNTGGMEYGVFSINSAITVRRTRVHENTSKRNWGFIAGFTASLIFEDCEFTDNKSLEGGIVIDGVERQAHFRNCLFARNTATTTDAVLSLHGNGAAVFEHCEFRDNMARDGGVGSVSAEATPNFTDCTFIGNRAGKTAGVFRVLQMAKLRCTGCSFERNSARSDAGAIYLEAMLDIRNSSFVANTAHFGAVMAAGLGQYDWTNYDCDPEDNLFQRTLFSRNVASQAGGVFYWGGGSQPFCADMCPGGDCEFEGNVALYGNLTAAALPNQLALSPDQGLPGGADASCPCLPPSASQDADADARVIAKGIGQGTLRVQAGLRFGVTFDLLDFVDQVITECDSFMQLQAYIHGNATGPSQAHLQGQSVIDVRRGLARFSDLRLLGEPGEYNIRVSTVKFFEDDTEVTFDIRTTLRPCDEAYTAVRDPIYRCTYVPKVRLLPPGLSRASVALAGVLALTSLAAHAFIHRNRMHPLIKASSIPFLHAMAAGSLFGYGVLALQGFDPTSKALCMSNTALLTAWFSLTFGSLFAKNMRIHRLFNSNDLRIKNISNRDLLTRVAAFSLLDVCVITVWTILDPSTPALIEDPTNELMLVWQCRSQHSLIWFALYALPKALALGYGSYIAWKVRSVAERWNESKYIGYCINNISLMCILVLPLQLLLSGQAEVLFVMFFITTVIAVFGTMCVLFLPKMWIVYSSPATKGFQPFLGAQHLAASTKHNVSTKGFTRASSTGSSLNGGSPGHDASAAAPNVNAPGPTASPTRPVEREWKTSLLGSAVRRLTGTEYTPLVEVPVETVPPSTPWAGDPVQQDHTDEAEEEGSSDELDSQRRNMRSVSVAMRPRSSSARPVSSVESREPAG